ncbi:DgyrCDS4914 [Dimorphilus gyrociliatus]|uniref:DgyrCDS4914 n=1 Tax=Dimorphilus gyrociliatus TaxID=2664684 RepID=A0A7I8VI53_9ANNE|nr:DgyrCDS4914 [Dimorphilus gyrociliatus]
MFSDSITYMKQISASNDKSYSAWRVHLFDNSYYKFFSTVDHWLAIHLVGLYSVEFVDILPNPNVQYMFFISVTNYHPSAFWPSPEKEECGSFNATRAEMYTVKCRNRGVIGEFLVVQVHMVENQNGYIRYISAYGKYIGPTKNNTNAALEKPAWFGKLVSSAKSEAFVTDDLISYSASIIRNFPNPWVMIDLLNNYVVHYMTYNFDRHNNRNKEYANLKGHITQKPILVGTNIDVDQFNCFENNKISDSGRYMGWSCFEPYPIGRFALFFISSSDTMYIRETGVYGVKLATPLAKLTSVNVNTIDPAITSSLHKSHPIQAIDNSYLAHIYDQVHSCGRVKDATESRYSINLDSIYDVYQILVIFPMENINLFLEVVVGVETVEFLPEINVCGVTKNIGRMPYYFNCSHGTTGNRISLYKSQGYIQICEVKVYGVKSEVKSRERLKATLFYNLQFNQISKCSINSGLIMIFDKIATVYGIAIQFEMIPKDYEIHLMNGPSKILCKAGNNNTYDMTELKNTKYIYFHCDEKFYADTVIFQSKDLAEQVQICNATAIVDSNSIISVNFIDNDDNEEDDEDDDKDDDEEIVKDSVLFAFK